MGRDEINTHLKEEERKIAEIKKSKKNVLMVSLLICILATTLITLNITSASGDPDIEVTEISPVTYPDWDSPSYNLTFGVFVKNNGDGPGTFTLTLYNDTSSIGTKNVTLNAGAKKLVKFTLNQPALSGFPNDAEQAWEYPEHQNIWANATTLEGEEIDHCDTANVTVRWTGDFNGDGHVDQNDKNAVILYQSNFTYSVYVDFNGDGTINILDLVECIINWHKGPLDYCDITISNVTLSNRNRPFHENETLSWIYANSTINVVVAVKNNGNTTETCTINAYYKINGNDWILIGNTSVTDLAPNETRNATILWNVPSIEKDFPYEECTVNATVLPFLYEDNKDNNWNQSASVSVRWPGDITGDGHINDDDLTGPFRQALDSYEKHSDLNGDGVVDTEDVKILIDNWKNGPEDN